MQPSVIHVREEVCYQHDNGIYIPHWRIIFSSDSDTTIVADFSVFLSIFLHVLLIDTSVDIC